jgi:uncharacterized membrane protein YbhN (UPF0104 family)
MSGRRPCVSCFSRRERGRELEAVLKQRRTGVAWTIGVLLLAVLVVVVGRRAEGRRFAELLRHAQLAWLGVAVVLQVATYVCAAAIWQRALRRNSVRLSVRGLVPLGLAKLFADQALPSAGMSGTLLVVRGLTRRGVSRGLAVAAMLADLVSFYAAYALAVAVALGILWDRGELHRVVVGLGFAFALLATSVPLAILWMRSGAERRLPHWMRRLPRVGEAFDAISEGRPGTIFGVSLGAETVTLQLAILAFDAVTLGVMLHAVATPAPPAIVFASFVVASMVATLAWVPGGLGTFEGTCVAMLNVHGVPIEAALAGTLLARGFTFWLPMPPGLAIARHEMLQAGE